MKLLRLRVDNSQKREADTLLASSGPVLALRLEALSAFQKDTFPGPDDSHLAGIVLHATGPQKVLQT